MEQSQWVMETEAKLKLEVVSMEGLKRLVKQAAVMEQSRVVQVVSRRMRELLTAAHDWENEAKTALKQRWVWYTWRKQTAHSFTWRKKKTRGGRGEGC